MKHCLIALCLVGLKLNAVSAEHTRPLPICPGDEASEIFSLEADGVDIPVALGEFNGGRSFHVAAVEIESTTTITLRTSVPTIESLRIRPRRHNIDIVHQTGQVQFKLAPAQKLVLEVAGQRPLILFALPVENDKPSIHDPSVIYFGPGEHVPGEIRMKTGQQLYLAAGARVRGTVYALEAENLVIRGRGVLDARGLTTLAKRNSGILFERCKNITVQGIQLRTGDWWQALFLLCDNVYIEHLHTLSFGRNNDGVDVDGVSNLVVVDSFIGCGDDGFGWHALDAVSFGEPPTRNCRAERCVIWNEHAGNGLRIGASMETQVFEDVVFRDIDVLQAVNNAIMSDHSDWAHVRNVFFDRFDNDTLKPLANIAIAKTRYSNLTGYRDRRGNISSVLFRNVRTSGGGVQLRGAGPKHKIVGVTFEGCLRQGRPFAPTDVKLGPYVEDLSFEAVPMVRVAEQQLDPTGRDPYQPQELILDNDHSQSWAFAGEGLRILPCGDAHDGETWILDSLGWGHAAVFTPQVDGRYQISVHWGTHTDVATRAPWTVKHAEGYTTKVFNQNNSPGWRSLGSFHLDAKSWVRLVDPHYQISNGPVVADAVRFRLVD